jgi:hypothetical protein
VFYDRVREQQELDAAHHATVAELLGTPRRSRRLRRGRASDSTEGDVWTVSNLQDLDIIVQTKEIECVHTPELHHHSLIDFSVLRGPLSTHKSTSSA